MNAPELLATLRERGARLSVRTGDFGAAVLNVAPRGIASDLAGEVARFKPSLLELLEGERREAVADVRARASRLRLERLFAVLGNDGACRAVYATGRRLQREKPDFWRHLNASDRHELAVCVALLDASLSPEEETR